MGHLPTARCWAQKDFARQRTAAPAPRLPGRRLWLERLEDRPAPAIVNPFNFRSAANTTGASAQRNGTTLSNAQNPGNTFFNSTILNCPLVSQMFVHHPARWGQRHRVGSVRR
jgi:hypothetical protein